MDEVIFKSTSLGKFKNDIDFLINDAIPSFVLKRFHTLLMVSSYTWETSYLIGPKYVLFELDVLFELCGDTLLLFI